MKKPIAIPKNNKTAVRKKATKSSIRQEGQDKEFAPDSLENHWAALCIPGRERITTITHEITIDKSTKKRIATATRSHWKLPFWPSLLLSLCRRASNAAT